MIPRSAASGQLEKWHKVSAQTSKSCIVVSSQTIHSKMINNDTLEMLSAREQLMEDINAIIETFCWEMWEGKYPETQEDLTRILCDAVCKNFPTK